MLMMTKHMYYNSKNIFKNSLWYHNIFTTLIVEININCGKKDGIHYIVFNYTLINLYFNNNIQKFCSETHSSFITHFIINNTKLLVLDKRINIRSLRGFDNTIM